jgi:hypothetical protein
VVADASRALPGRVMDLSREGIRLALHGWIEPGTILGIEWQSRLHCMPCFLLAIIHSVVAQTGGGWVVTGRFAHTLNADVWHMLL